MKSIKHQNKIEHLESVVFFREEQWEVGLTKSNAVFVRYTEPAEDALLFTFPCLLQKQTKLSVYYPHMPIDVPESVNRRVLAALISKELVRRVHGEDFSESDPDYFFGEGEADEFEQLESLHIRRAPNRTMSLAA